MKVAISVLLVVVACSPSVESLRILAMFHSFAKSHHQLYHSVVKVLANAGHDVVLFTPFPMDSNHPNVTTVFLDNIETENAWTTKAFKDLADDPRWYSMEVFGNFHDKIFSDFIHSPQVQDLLVSKEKFDVVVAEAFIGGQEFTLVLGHVFKVPVIAIQTQATNSIINRISGNFLYLSYLPDFISNFSHKMTFFERLLNTLYITRGLYYVYPFHVLPKIERNMRKYFPNLPPLLDMISNVSLVFLNDHGTAQTIFPRTPNIIPIAGLHIEAYELQQLPKDIKKFMDEAKDGVILFSLGTYVRDDFQPQDYFKMYIRVFKQLKQRVIWKTRSAGSIEGLPENVMAVKWFPQKECLAHPNAAVFLTHGGQSSTLEAIHYGVPVVCVPQFWDQYRNCKYFEEEGLGVQLYATDLSEDNVLKAFKTIVDNSSYKANIQKMSKVFRDQPMSPAQTLVFWTEYVVRHHGAAHLKPASTQLSWYQLYLLDVIAVIIAITAITITVLYLTLRKIVLELLIIFGTKNKLKSS